MRPLRAIAASLLLIGLAPSVARADDQRSNFDIELFRPSADPRDLVMVMKSETVGHLSPTVGAYLNFALKPLSLFNQETGTIQVPIDARLTLIGLASIGFWGWFDLGVAMPFIVYQSGQTQHDLGLDETVQATALSDMRIQTKIALWPNRRKKVNSGMGLAIAGHVNIPTGSRRQFASDGTITGGFSLIADYRFSFGLILAANGGMWLRPGINFNNTHIGDMVSFGLAAEQIIVRKWLLSVIAEGYGYASIRTYQGQAPQVPVEALLGIRWHTTYGLSVTIGAGFGADCGFGLPAFRLFTSLTWQPSKSREQEEIDRLRQLAIEDPDGDGITGETDKCPREPGPPENGGCPDQDSDADGVVDRLDKCPDVPGRVDKGKGVGDGCISAELVGNKIVLRVPILFATDESETIRPESHHVLEDVAWLLKQHVEIAMARVEAHTDSRGGAAHNLTLSQMRAASVVAKLKEYGVAISRMRPEGYGSRRPLVDDRMCQGYDPTSRSGSTGGLNVSKAMDAPCRDAAAKNRRVEIVIEKVDHNMLKSLPKGLAPASDLPSGELPKGGLPEGGLKGGGGLPEGQLPTTNLPQGTLPQGSELPAGDQTLDTTVKDAPAAGDKAKPESKSRHGGRSHSRHHKDSKDSKEGSTEGKSDAGGDAPLFGAPRKK